jgi:hypothetical protein
MSAPLSVTLEEQDIENCTGYEALSYVWGHSVSPTPIMRDGQPMQIQANLEAALRSLRYPGRTRRLWVDAICINQEDKIEKNNQIPLMRRIYQHAERTIVWLGPTMPGVRQSFALAEELARRRARLIYTVNDNTRVSPAAGHNLTPESVRDTINPGSEDWRSLSDIMAVTWWERIWCIQELVVSSPVVARCGNFETPMVNLLASTPYVSYWRTRTSNEQYENLWFWNDVYLEKFREPPNSPAHWRHGRRVINFLPLVRSFKCTNPRDRVFALIGIIGEKLGGFERGGDMWNVLDGDVGVIRSKLTEVADNLSLVIHGLDDTMDQDMRQALSADYRKPPEQVFRDITRYLIRRYHILNILSQAEYVEKEPFEEPPLDKGDIEPLCLPSWVPNYSEKMFADSAMGPVSWFRAGFCLGYRQYLAPKHHHRLHRRTLNLNVLSLDGFLVDRVERTTAVISTDPKQPLMFDDYWRQIHGSSVLPLEISVVKKVEEFGITLMGGCPHIHPFKGPEGSVDINIDEAIPWVNKNNERLACLVHAHLRTVYKLRNTYPSPRVQARFMTGDEITFQNQAKKWSHGRKVYKTSKGTFGLGPAGTQPGDQVVVLLGGRIPFVIRPSSEGRGWLLVGETYLHNVHVMTGKVADLNANGFLKRKMKVYDIY